MRSFNFNNNEPVNLWLALKYTSFMTTGSFHFSVCWVMGSFPIVNSIRTLNYMEPEQLRPIYDCERPNLLPVYTILILKCL